MKPETTPKVQQHIFFFDVLRCVAAMAVVLIHSLGPYREEFGEIAFFEWASAVGLNGVLRWAVPVFIMISGALMLSDNRPFDFKYYVKRRLGKVLIPFVVWSLFYAYLSGWGADGFNSEVSQQVLSDSFHHETYYHLGFFYYFLPLYLVIPFYQVLVKHISDQALYCLVSIWLFLSTLFLFDVESILINEYMLYSGYLLLGYVCYQKLPLTKSVLMISIGLGVVALAITVFMVLSLSLEAREYTVNKWLSYKTLNTALAATMIFVSCRYFGERLAGKMKGFVSVISRYSLGIYILHPLFLWPMLTFGWHQGNPILLIPFWALVSGACALGVSWLLSQSNKTKWLVP
ncbi:MAG: acyltransferase [Vibrio sp.]